MKPGVWWSWSTARRQVDRLVASGPRTALGWAGRARAGLPSLAVVLVFSVVAAVPVAPVQALQLTTADMLFLWQGGPALGWQPAPTNVVLVYQDQKTYQELGILPPTTADDLTLYRNLLAAGATAVGDTRPLFTNSPGARQLLEKLATVDPAHRVVRDVVLTGDTGWLTANEARYLPHVASDPFRFDAGFDLTDRVRYYPLLSYNGLGFDETLALKTARNALGLPPPASVPRLARETGIARQWIQLAARAGLALGPLPASLRQAPTGWAPYPFGPGRALPWVSAPSREQVLLISPAALWINYLGPPGSFPAVSYVDVLRRRIPPSEFRGKVVVIGTQPIAVDTYPVPTSPTRRASGAEIVATVVQNILDRRFMQPLSFLQEAGAIWLLGLAGGWLFRRLRPARASAGVFGLLFFYLTYSTGLYRSGRFPDLILAPGALLATAVVQGGYGFVREERARRQVTDLFGRYVPRSVVARLVQRPDQALLLSGSRREVTVLFADIRGFTAFSEPLPPEQVLSELNALLQTVVACIFRHDGTVDKYIGDAVMVLFNAPLDQPDHPERAVQVAIEMQEALAAGGGNLALGIGIHTGEAVVGNVGTPDRLEYTAIGRTVNLAARLCETAGKGEVIISNAVYERVKDVVVVEPRPPLRVKGIDRELITYRALGADGIC